MADQLHVHISGRVQGVGFRDATTRRASKMGLTGWVRNLPDGRVEAVFQGNRDDLQQMLAWCQDGPGLARVEDVDVRWEEPDKTYSDFRIAF